MQTIVRRTLLLLLSMSPLVLSSCSNEQTLQGRWYNRANSLRFQPGGVVVWYSEQGTATGRYFYDGSKRRTTTDTPVHNMTMQLVRRGRNLHGEYELQFLGGDRLRITQLNQRRRRTFQEPPVMVLKKADEDSPEPLPTPTPEPEESLGTPINQTQQT